MSPRRIQRRRTRGWRMPEGAVYVGRPSPWGNPFRPDAWAAVALGFRGDPQGRRAAAVALFRAWLGGMPVDGGGIDDGESVIEFTDGTRRTIGEQVRLFAAAVAAPLPVPHVRPDVTTLRDRDLACWCPLDQPCHADVLLELANGGASL